MKRTEKYDLAYFEEGDLTLSIPETQRWITLDVQLFSLFEILGNGIISGWNILPSSGLSIVVSAGSGHVNFVAVQSDESVSVVNLVPETRNYIYATLTADSYWTKDVDFVGLISEDEDDDRVYLGYVDTDSTSVTAVNSDGRKNLGFIDLIQELVADHRHIGGETNPPQVNLSTDVQGILNQRSIPDLDASIIKTGTIDDDRLPAIDHITKLINQGTLTHAQLDSFVETLSLANPSLMGEVSTVNLLQLVLALKHIYPDIDEFLVNEIAFIPGISPNSYIDTENTTADVDTRTWAEGGQHTITGTPVSGRQAYTKTWDTETEFESGTREDVFINGDSVVLDASESVRILDTFDSGDFLNWDVITRDLSSVTEDLSVDGSSFVIGTSSAKLSVESQDAEVVLIVQKSFSAEDWSDYKHIVFSLKTSSVQHGDVFFFMRDAVYGTQSSYTKVLDRNSPTINNDTLQTGWQQFIVDITPYQRDNVNQMGFYVSSQEGWDTAAGFEMNIDDIYLTGGNRYADQGYVRVVFGTGFPYEFWRVRWDALMPTGGGTAATLKSRTRVGNTLDDLSQSTWSSYSDTNGYEISLPVGSLYKYIEIEMYFNASSDLTKSAVLRKIFLDFYASDVESSFNYDSQDDWESGDTFNIDTTTNPGSIMISETQEVNDVFYGTDGSAGQLDDDLRSLYQITGSLLPRSTYQAVNDLPPGLGLVSGIARGDDGNIWVADTDNDRVVEFTKSGDLVTGFYGAFLKEIVSSTDSSTTTTTTLAAVQYLDVLQAIYNQDKGYLYIVMDSEDVGTITLDTEKAYLQVGANRVYLSDFAVLYPKTFVFRLTIGGSEKTALDKLISPEAPSIWAINPYQNQAFLSSSVQVRFLVRDFEIGTESGQNGIRIWLDGNFYQDIYSDRLTISGLSSGIHRVAATLLNADGSTETNVEATASFAFIVATSAVSEPHVSITSPKPNQIYSASPVRVDFDVDNFAVLPTGQHVRYSVDGSSPSDHYSLDPIIVEDLEAGEHSIRIYLVDSRGNDLGYQYGSATVTFQVGVNSNARLKLYMAQGAVSSVAGIQNQAIVHPVDVDNIVFGDMYSPIDVQVIPAEISATNPTGKPSVVIAKLESGEASDVVFNQVLVDLSIPGFGTTITTDLEKLVELEATQFSREYLE